jgi:hypothetical protein
MIYKARGKTKQIPGKAVRSQRWCDLKRHQTLSTNSKNSLGRQGLAGLAAWYIILHIYATIQRHPDIEHAYGLLNLTQSLQQPCKTHVKLKRNPPESWPDCGGTIPAQYRIYMSSRKGMAPYGKAWRTLATARFPCILQ